MSRQNYIITISVIILTLIVDLPYHFYELEISNYLRSKYEVSLLQASLIMGFLFWVVVLHYFYQKKWTTLFVVGIIHGIVVLSVKFLFIMSVDQPETATPIVGTDIILISVATELAYEMVILLHYKTRNLPLLRFSAVLALVGIICYLYTMFNWPENCSFFTGSLAVLGYTLFILHFVLERNKKETPENSNDILDDIQ